jgi:L-ascorbate metabolism protein UlaG (beta-lactamase superfamily)
MAFPRLDCGVKITFLGHACFRLVSLPGTVIIVDPWIRGNPQAGAVIEELGKLDFILVTHGHGDHLGDALELAQRSGAVVIAMPEICHYLAQKGLHSGKALGMNKGGTVAVADLRVTMVHALHSSSIADNDHLIYGGEAAGFVMRFAHGFTAYHAGDTAVFSDLRIIGDLYHPEVAMLPIGSHYVMGPEEATYACELLKPRYAIPMHFGTFPVLTGTPERFRELMKRLPEVAVVVLRPGETIE